LPDFTSFRIAWQSSLLSIMRIMIGLLFMEHGLAKVLDFPHRPNHVPFVLTSLNPGLQGSLELVGGFLIVIGLFTRPVAFILAGDMAVAYFMSHAPKGFFPLLNGGELAIVYCFVFLYFWLAGPGEWALDRLRAPAAGRDSGSPSWRGVALAEPWMVARVPPGETSVAAAGESRRWPEDAAAGAEERSRLPR
jgi:putative oxidoreductase